MLRFGRVAVAGALALALVTVGTAGPTAVSVEAAEESAAPVNQVRTGTVRPLRGDAVRAVVRDGRWFHTTSQEIRLGAEGLFTTSRQTLITITDPRARQRFSFDVVLPPGGYLALEGGGLVAFDVAGAVLGRLQPPWAVDAKGVSVTTRFEVLDRDTFVQVVEHRPVASYPVLADPWFVVPVLLRAGAQHIGRYVVRRSTYEAAKRAALRMAADQASRDIDELMAKQPVQLKALTAANFRENVRRRTGWRHASIKPYDAHHTLPKKFEPAFRRAGLNIHNPVFGHWWCRSAHRSFAARYNRGWEAWLRTRRADIANTKTWRNRIENKRIAMVSNSAWANTYQCP